MRLMNLTMMAAISALLAIPGCANRSPPSPQAATAPAAAGAASSLPPSAPDQIVRSQGMNLVGIAPGEFVMGNGRGANATERDHPVRITRPYLIGVTEVTQAQWAALMPDNPSRCRGDDLPVTNITWLEATEFCRRLSVKEGRIYRLPTEAEWEYACRAGTSTAFSFGDSAAALDAFAWFNRNARGVPQRVATKKANPWGLYDMHGNVREWCSDWFSFRYPAGVQVDPAGPDSGSERVRRGGCVGLFASAATSGARDCGPPDASWDDVGFRVAADKAP